MPTTATHAVIGMTCGHCAAAVSAELTQQPRVSDVAVALAPGDVSTVAVTSDTPLTREQVASALNEAGGYHLATD